MKEAEADPERAGRRDGAADSSAHRASHRCAEFAENAEKNGIEVIIAGAGAPRTGGKSLPR